MSANPHIRDKNSPLEALMLQALRRYGEFGVSTIDSEIAPLLLDLANMVLSDINTHPYFDADPLEPYTHQTEARAIDDQLMVAGILAHYATQQGSPKAQLYNPMYLRLMNRTLWETLSGGGGKIQMRVTDDGTGTAGVPRAISKVTGRPE